MDLGALNRRITFRRAILAESEGALNPTPTWYDHARAWASYTPISDAERIRAEQTGATITARFLIRWTRDLADINPKDQLRFEGALYAISAVKPIGLREEIEITATALADV